MGMYTSSDFKNVILNTKPDLKKIVLVDKQALKDASDKVLNEYTFKQKLKGTLKSDNFSFKTYSSRVSDFIKNSTTEIRIPKPQTTLTKILERFGIHPTQKVSLPTDVVYAFREKGFSDKDIYELLNDFEKGKFSKEDLIDIARQIPSPGEDNAEASAELSKLKADEALKLSETQTSGRSDIHEDFVKITK